MGQLSLMEFGDITSNVTMKVQSKDSNYYQLNIWKCGVHYVITWLFLRLGSLNMSPKLTYLLYNKIKFMHHVSDSTV